MKNNKTVILFKIGDTKIVGTVMFNGSKCYANVVSYIGEEVFNAERLKGEILPTDDGNDIAIKMNPLMEQMKAELIEECTYRRQDNPVKIGDNDSETTCTVYHYFDMGGILKPLKENDNRQSGNWIDIGRIDERDDTHTASSWSRLMNRINTYGVCELISYLSERNNKLKMSYLHFELTREGKHDTKGKIVFNSPAWIKTGDINGKPILALVTEADFENACYTFDGSLMISITNYKYTK